MSTVAASPTTHKLFRGAALAAALFLGFQAAWVLVPEFYRLPKSNTSIAKYSNAFTTRDLDNASFAATFAMIRGDLWSELALAVLHQRPADRERGDAPIDRTREIADRAIALAPYNGGVWLVIASVNSRFDWLNRKATAALRMSYYTAANETELIPLRLSLAIQFVGLSDSDFQELVRHDIRTIVTHRPELKPAIVATYRGAPPIGRQFIEDSIKEIDPALLEGLHKKG